VLGRASTNGLGARSRPAVGVHSDPAPAGRKICVAAALAVLLVASSGGQAAPSKRDRAQKDAHDALEVVGLATQIAPNQVTVLGKDGREVTLVTHEDFTERVAVGSKVTAWYYLDDSGNLLKSLEVPPENFFVPASEIRSDINKTILLPSSEVPGTDDFCGAIAQFLQSRWGWYVAPAFLAKEIRRRGVASGSMLDAFNPKTRQFDMARYTKRQGLIPRLASETRVGSVLEVEVVETQAEVKRLVGYWDGTEEPLAGPGMRAVAKLSFFPNKGTVPAATATLKLWDRNGKLLWSNRRGLALLVTLRGHGRDLRDRPLSEFLNNTTEVEQWLESAFGSLDRAAAQPAAP
jgi:hypothetical protein